MILDQAEKIVEWLNDHGVEAEVRKGYSGRNMYGKQTAGVVSKRIIDIGIAVGALGFEELLSILSCDNMGLQYVVY